jgi:membrane-bound ClpP family serine protease
MSVKNVFIRVSIFNVIYFLIGTTVIYVLDLPLYLLVPLGGGILLWARYSYEMNIAALKKESVLKMEGKKGTVVEELAPYGTVKIDNEYWKAYADTPITEGKRVTVTGTEGLTLHVGVENDQG